MTYLKLVFTLSLFQCFINCTIDVNVSEISYLSHNLSPKECRRLYAALQFLTYDLPMSVYAEDKPKNETCFKLLAQWNSGTEKWEGKGKTHVEIEQRLRQIGRPDLADWLGKTVFHKLAVNAIYALNNSFIESDVKIPVLKLYKKGTSDESYWTILDSVLWGVLIGLVGMIMFTTCRIIYLECKKKVVRQNVREEMLDLLNPLNVDSDQETIFEYECVVKRE